MSILNISTYTTPGGDVPTVLDRYDRILKLAEDFRCVVEAVFDHPTLEAPDGMRGSRMSWTKQVGNTKHMAWITRVAAETRSVVFTIAHFTPDMPAALVNHGRQTFDKMLPNAHDPALLDVLNRFAAHWREARKHDVAEKETL
jgi:hypothetical protein